MKILGTFGDRGTHPPVTGEDVPNTWSTFSQWASGTRAPTVLGREGAETGRTTTVETKTQNPLANLASAETQTTKPIHGNITKELPSKMGIDV